MDWTTELPGAFWVSWVSIEGIAFPLEALALIGITKTLAEALEFLRERNLIHRDLKPQVGLGYSSLQIFH